MKKLIFILALSIFACSDRGPSNSTMTSAECALTYDTNDVLFTDEDTLVFGVSIVHFMNGNPDYYDETFLEAKLAEASNFYKSAKIKFKLLSYENVSGRPVDKMQLTQNVQNKLDFYDINNYQFFGMMLNQPHTINVYIYNQPERTPFAGVAGGIGSDYLAIRKDYFDAPARTFVHELGHCLGLYHTHEPDDTSGFTVYEGDKVCDTPSSRSLSGRVNKECSMQTAIMTVSDSVQLKNIMSYSYPYCRDNFTDGQIKRMRWFIEQSKDLQSLLYNRHELFNRKLEESWIDIN